MSSITQRLSSQAVVRIAAVVLLVCACIIPVFVRSPYYLNVLILVLLRAVLAMSFIMLLRVGMISLAITAFWGTGAYMAMILSVKLGLSVWISLPAAALITGVIAIGVGYVLIRSGASGLQFVVLSVVIGMMFPVLVGNIGWLGGNSGVNSIPGLFPVNANVPYFYVALAIVVIIVVGLTALYKSRIGRAWTSIGLNQNLAKSIGINVNGYRLLAFVISSIMVGLVGAYTAHFHTFVVPSAYGMWQNMYLQEYAILGGIGFAVAGPLLGAGIMTAVPELLRANAQIAPIAMGLILVLLILFLPQGLLGALGGRRGSVMDYLRRVIRPVSTEEMSVSTEALSVSTEAMAVPTEATSVSSDVTALRKDELS